MVVLPRRKTVWMGCVLSLLIAGCQAEVKVPFRPAWADQGKAIQLASGTAPVPVGLYSMIRVPQCQAPDGQDPAIATIIRQPFVQALALGMTWEDLQPGPGEFTFDKVQMCLDAIARYSQQAGRPQSMPVLLKLYVADFTPRWMMSDTVDESTEPHVVTNKIGMKVLRMPSHQDATGRRLEAREHPFSIDPVYHEQLRKMMAVLAAGLDRVDPKAVRVPMIHVIGPAMNSNQMRMPGVDLFPNRGEDRWGAGWTKEKHLAAWKSVCVSMRDFPAFAKRVWVFNFTNLRARTPGALALTTSDQVSVFDAIRAAHPAGPAAVVAKEESFTVDFGRAGNKVPTSEGSRWRNQMLEHREQIPYYYLAELPLAHAWEVWAGLSFKRDRRAPAQYPMSEAIENSLFSDLNQPHPSKPQGTLWVELWMEETLRPEHLERFDGSSDPLPESLKRWDEAIRAQLHSMAP